MNTEFVKLGVVGLGRGKDLAKEIVGDDNVKITAIADINPETLEKAKAEFEEAGVDSFECFNTFDEMLERGDMDAVLIATDAVCHTPYVIRAMDAGKHVLSEIPAVNSIEEARELKAAVLRHPELKYMTGENCCYWAFIQAWKQFYDEGKLGEAVYAESEYLHSRDFRNLRPENYSEEHWRSYNPAIKYLTHNLGPLLYIMDDECVSVSCMDPDVEYNPYRRSKNSVAIFKTKKGAVIRILICFDAYVRFDHNFSIIGTRGTIETDRIKSVKEAHSFARFSDIPGSISDKVDIPVTWNFLGEEDAVHGGADRKMIREFIKCILEDTKPPIDVDLGIRMTIPGIIAAESAARGGELMEIPSI